MNHEHDLQITTRLSQHAFQNIKRGNVSLREFDGVLDTVEKLAEILNHDIPMIDRELAKIGKTITQARWRQSALNALESLIPKIPHQLT